MKQPQPLSRPLRRTVFNTVFLFLAMCCFQGATAQEATLIQVSGKVIDQNSGDALEGVSIHVKNSVTGTITNKQGEFSIRTRLKCPFFLVFSSVGYHEQEFEVKGTNS